MRLTLTCVVLELSQLEVAIETVVGVDQAGYRPLHWLLLGKALVVGTGHVRVEIENSHRRTLGSVVVPVVWIESNT